ncbi:MAG: hypothetical protein ISR83_02625 [Candidatus Marinimicrobia bacterium]|nr:hypothetical protein [Candidatus Neomarinimicrobiota bacterium]
MKHIKYILRRFIIILPLMFFTLNAQDEATEEVATPEVPAEEVVDAEAPVEETVEVEDVAVAEPVEEESTGSGFTVGVAPSIGLVSGETFTNVPVGATVVITTPYGFKLGPLDFTISAAVGGYAGSFDEEDFNPSVMGVGGNLVLANFVFAEGHAGIVGSGTGIRGFAGVSLEYLMKKALNLPVNILIGGEGFISTDMAGVGNSSGWGGLGVRLDYDL